MVGDQILPAIQNGDRIFAARRVTQHIQREKRDHQAADQQTDSIDRIRYRNRLQTAEDRIDRTNHTDRDAKHADRLEFRDPQPIGQVKDIFKHQRAGIQNDRNLYNQIKDDICDAEPQLGGAVKSQADQLRDGGDSAFQIPGRRPQCQHDQCGSRQNLERHRAHAHRPGLTVRAYKLLCGKIGQQQGTCNHKARQAAARQKITVCCGLIIPFGLHIGNDRDQNGKRHKCEYRKCHDYKSLYYFILFH